MTPSPRHSLRNQSRISSNVLILFCLVGTACGMMNAPAGKLLLEDPSETVSLHTIPDHSIHANHPINLKPALLARVLKGIQVQDQGDRLLQRLVAGPSSPVPAFSDEEIQYLAPLLAEGLRNASPDQQIDYRVRTLYEGAPLEYPYTETTAGSLYVYDQQLFVILSQYRYSKVRTNIYVRNINYQSVGLDYNGLKNRILVFTPKAAQRSDSFAPPPVGRSINRFLAIDYQLLQQAPVATTGPSAPEGAGASDSSAPSAEALTKREAEIQALKDRVNKNASEMETLRKELQSVQEQLGSQATGQDKQKRKTNPSPNP